MVSRTVGRPGTLAIVTPYEAGSLWAQWVGSVSAALAVLVAALFGYLTYANNRRSRDNQERASLAAASVEEAGARAGLLPASGAKDVNFRIRHDAGETWLLMNEGPGTARDVRIEGLTKLDRQRLTVTSSETTALEPGEALEFVLVSRFTLSGPANVVVHCLLDPEGDDLRQVLQVPAP